MSKARSRQSTKPALAATPKLPPPREGFVRHPLPVFAQSSFEGALIDCVRTLTPSGHVRDVLVLVVHDGAPVTLAMRPHSTELEPDRAKRGDVVHVDAPELLALAQLSQDANAVPRVHLHRAARWVADIAREPIPRSDA